MGGWAWTLALVAAAAGDTPPAALRAAIDPRFCLAPCSVRVAVTVPADERNRALRVAAESPDFYRSSTVQLDGRDAMERYRFYLKYLPPGRYRVDVVVTRADGTPVRLRREFEVGGTQGMPVKHSH